MVRLNDRKLSTSINLKCVSLKEKRKIIDSKEKTGLIFQLCKILIQTETEKLRLRDMWKKEINYTAGR